MSVYVNHLFHIYIFDLFIYDTHRILYIRHPSFEIFTVVIDPVDELRLEDWE